MKIIKSALIVFAASTLLASCGSHPYASTNKIHKNQTKVLSKELETLPPPRPGVFSALKYADTWVGTTNFNLRRPNIVVIHHTAQDSVAQTLKTFTLERTQVSSHYVIGKDGEIYHMLNDLYRAWHGGNSRWGSNTDLNSSSIGIELDNNGFETFSQPQIASLIALLKDLKEKYKIPAANFIGHSDIAPTRKNDPNRTFPWKELAEEGFGLWYDEIPFIHQPLSENPSLSLELPEEIKTSDSLKVSSVNAEVPEPLIDVAPEIALKIIGYDVSNLPAAIKAFKLHFIQNEVSDTLTDYDLRVLNNLYKKYL